MLPLIPFFPLAGFLFNATIGRRSPKAVSGLVGTGAMAAAFGVAVVAVMGILGMDQSDELKADPTKTADGKKAYLAKRA